MHITSNEFHTAVFFWKGLLHAGLSEHYIAKLIVVNLDQIQQIFH